MQIAIEIPDRIYSIVQNKPLNIIDSGIVEKAIKNGTPQPKVGEWLKNGELCKCSNCHSNVLLSAVKCYNYCYHCGARMEVET